MPKPKAIHDAQGTRARGGAGRGVDYEIIRTLPPPPGFLGPDGVELWNDLGAQFIAAGVLQKADLYMLRLLAGLWDRNQSAMRLGHEILASDNATIHRLLAEFGASPSSRRRVAPNEGNGAQNPFGKFKVVA